jgi:hypothetical protein
MVIPLLKSPSGETWPMKASNSLWREQLTNQMPAHLAHELDIFDAEIALKKQGKIEDKVFAETRLRRGCYGQRYDNGQRHDGRTTRKLQFPTGELTKGPNTIWDAPGMQRIKIPFGGLNARASPMSPRGRTSSFTSFTWKILLRS